MKRLFSVCGLRLHALRITANTSDWENAKFPARSEYIAVNCSEDACSRQRLTPSVDCLAGILPRRPSVGPSVRLQSVTKELATSAGGGRGDSVTFYV